MTTVVYREGVMASDSLITRGGTKSGIAKKVGFLSDGRMFGWSGSVSDGQRFASWYDRGCNVEDRYIPNFKDCSVLVAIGDNSAMHWGGAGATPCFLEDDFFAIGSGWEIAMGAMEMGADAIKAVEVACRRDAHTGGQVHWIVPNDYDPSRPDPAPEAPCLWRPLQRLIGRRG